MSRTLCEQGNTIITKKITISLFAILVSIIGLSYFYSKTIEYHFDLKIPDTAQIIATNHDINIFDGSVSWVLKTKKARNLVLGEYIELQFSTDKNTKYQEIRSLFKPLYPSKFTKKSHYKIYVGGKSGNSFIGLSNNIIMLYRFWT